MSQQGARSDQREETGSGAGRLCLMLSAAWAGLQQDCEEDPGVWECSEDVW